MKSGTWYKYWKYNEMRSTQSLSLTNFSEVVQNGKCDIEQHPDSKNLKHQFDQEAS